MLQRVRERRWNKKNKHRMPGSYKEGDWVLVHHSRLPACLELLRLAETLASQKKPRD